MAFQLKPNKKQTENKTIRFPISLIEEIEKAIKKYGSNTQEMKQVAEALNIGIATLYRKVKKYNNARSLDDFNINYYPQSYVYLD